MTNRHDSLRTASAIAAAASLIATIGLSAPAAGRDAEESGAPGEHPRPRTRNAARAGSRAADGTRVASGPGGPVRSTRQPWSDGGAPSRHHPRFNPGRDRCDAMRGRPSARIRFIGTGHTATVEECANERCARAVAERASAVVAEAQLIPYAGSPGRSLAVRMCPAEGARTATRSSIPHWMRAGAQAPCKWRIVPAATLAAWPIAGRSDRVWIGDTIFRMHRAPLRLIHGS